MFNSYVEFWVEQTYGYGATLHKNNGEESQLISENEFGC